jgi:hypothetical protein
MPTIILHNYNPNEESLNAFNAPHKYRFARKMKMDTSIFEMAWESGKIRVLSKLNLEIRKVIDTSQPFAFAFAPSNTRIFKDDIQSAIAVEFPNAIDFSECFSKQNGFDAGVTTRVLTDDELRKSIAINAGCFSEKLTTKIKQILLIDDVYSLGNTLNGMELVISDIEQTREIFTIAILKTT